jgi:succinyl-CoA synthetase alpha subunit
MSILIGRETRVIVQGITGRDGSFHTKQMVEYGTNVVAGVTPGKGGQEIDGIPVFNSVNEAVNATGANVSVIFVPAGFASDAVLEASDSDLEIIICITEGVPVQEMIENYYHVKQKGKVLIGPNCPGLISPGKCKIGIMPGQIHKEGNIGVISRSGTLTYEVVYNLTQNKLGQSTCIGIGGDPIIGSGFIDMLKLFNDDPDTDAVVLIGEIGGNEEEKAAEWIKANFTKKAVAFISGRTAPPGKRMGHAGAIISGGTGTAEAKITALEEAGVPVVERPDQVAEAVKRVLSDR